MGLQRSESRDMNFRSNSKINTRKKYANPYSHLPICGHSHPFSRYSHKSPNTPPLILKINIPNSQFISVMRWQSEPRKTSHKNKRQLKIEISLLLFLTHFSIRQPVRPSPWPAPFVPSSFSFNKNSQFMSLFFCCH